MRYLLTGLLATCLTTFLSCNECPEELPTRLEFGTDALAFLQQEAGERADARFEGILGKLNPSAAHEQGPEAFVEGFVQAMEQAQDTIEPSLWEVYFPNTASSIAALKDSLLGRLEIAHTFNYNLLSQRNFQRGVTCARVENLPNKLKFILHTEEENNPGLQVYFTASAGIAFRETYEVSEAYDFLQAADELYHQQVVGVKEEALESPEVEAVSNAASEEKPASGSFEEMVAESKSQPTEESDKDMEKAKADFREKHPILGLFDLETPVLPDQASYGYALEEDIAEISARFGHPLVQDALPKNLDLVWSMQPELQNSAGKDLFGMYLLKKPREGSPAAELCDRHIQTTSVGDDGTGMPSIGIKFDAEGARLFESLSKSNIRRTIAIVYDGSVMTAPRVNGAISGGEIMLSGMFSYDECVDIAALLGAGALACPVQLLGGSKP